MRRLTAFQKSIFLPILYLRLYFKGDIAIFKQRKITHQTSRQRCGVSPKGIILYLPEKKISSGTSSVFFHIEVDGDDDNETLNQQLKIGIHAKISHSIVDNAEG